jgi:hypothetical protein
MPIKRWGRRGYSGGETRCGLVGQAMKDKFMSETRQIIATSLFDLLRDRVVIVTGGGKVIGKVYSKRLSEVGARVVIVEVDVEARKGVAEEIRASDNEAVAVATDVADWRERRSRSSEGSTAYQQRLAHERAASQALVRDHS